MSRIFPKQHIRLLATPEVKPHRRIGKVCLVSLQVREGLLIIPVLIASYPIDAISQLYYKLKFRRLKLVGKASDDFSWRRNAVALSRIVMNSICSIKTDPSEEFANKQ